MTLQSDATKGDKTSLKIKPITPLSVNTSTSDVSDEPTRDLGKVDVASLDQYTPVSGRLPTDGSGVTQPVSGPLTLTELEVLKTESNLELLLSNILIELKLLSYLISQGLNISDNIDDLRNDIEKEGD